MIFLRLLILLLIIDVYSIASAQFFDDFSDGDFTNNPTWIGDQSLFIINASNQLQLNSTAGNDSTFLVTSSTQMNNTEWQIWVRLTFTPSDNNHAKIYLTSDSENLRGPLNGYYIQTGATGTANKKIYFYRQNGTSRTLLHQGDLNFMTGTNNIFRLKITRDNLGNWEFFVDVTGGFNFFSEGTVFDDTYTTTSFFGVLCKYTSGNVNRFFYDDIYVGNPVIDEEPPIAESVTVVDENTLLLSFNEPITSQSAQNVTNYNINNGIGTPSSAILQPNSTDVILNLANSLQLGTNYVITISGIQDLSLNTMSSTQLSFSFYIPQPYDIIVNEIMANPTGVAGLPNAEYIELYNRSNFAINLANWTYRVSNSTRTLPDYILNPGEFLILVSEAAFPLFSDDINKLAIASFPSIPNSGSTIFIRNSDGILIHSVSYNSNWYGDASKSNGGWSLEAINPDDVCSGSSNWLASNAPEGGTPGVQNSIFNPQLLPFNIRLIRANNNNTVDVVFSKTLTNLEIPTSSIEVNNGVGNPSEVLGIFEDTLKLFFASNFVPNVEYQLSLNFPILDCTGNTMIIPATQSFVLYEPVIFDVVINEIMANESPQVGLPAFEWIEIHNRTDLPINIDNWTLQVNNTVRTIPTFQITAKSYAVLGPEGFQNSFPGVQAIGVTSFPALSNTGATVSIRHANGMLMHSVSYTESWYQNRSKQNGGWSLEQIDPNNPCAGAANWRASESPLGGTPGFTNSIKKSNPDVENPFAIRMGVLSSDSLIVYFNEPVLNTSISEFSFQSSVGDVLSVKVEEPMLNEVIIRLSNTMQDGQNYTLRVDGFTDCVGNVAEVTNFVYSLPTTAEPNDVVINEILYNSFSESVEWVELFNRSNKSIDLSKYTISNADTAAGILTNVRFISNRSALLNPGEYLVLSRNRLAIYPFYQIEDKRAFWDVVSTMPSFANTGGTAAFAHISQLVIDRFTYAVSFQFPLIRDHKGVSLERIDPERKTQDRFNWNSASVSAGGATPGYLNSQFRQSNFTGDEVKIDPQIFSPDNDGYNDVANILLNFETGGWSITITIFDSSGRLVRNLVQNQFSGSQSIFTWDGIDNSGQKARVGAYAVFIEAFNMEGSTARFKKTVVVAGR